MDMQTKVDITKAMGLVCDRLGRMKDTIMETKPVTTREIWKIIDDIVFVKSNPETTFSTGCSICMEDTVCDCTLSCGHAFHRSCISRWREGSSMCPYCRQPVMCHDDVDIKSIKFDLDYNDGVRTITRERDLLLSNHIDIGMEIRAHTSVISVGTYLNLYSGKPSFDVSINAITCGDISCDVPVADVCSGMICLENICEGVDTGEMCPILRELVQYWMYGQ